MMRAIYFALVRSEVRRLLKNRVAYVFAATVFSLMLLTIFSSPDEQSALLFMVAGDNPKNVGGAIGFIGNLVDDNDIAGSAARTSLVFTVLWIPLVIIYAVVVTAQDYSSASYDVTKARGVPDSILVLGKCATHGTYICLAYIVLNGTAYIYKLLQYGGSITLDDALRYTTPSFLAAIILATLFMEAFSLYQLTRSVAATSVIVVTFSVLVMAVFPSSYGNGAGPWSPILYLSPVFYLMNICALNFKIVGVISTLAYVAAAAFVTTVISVGALKMREVFR